jgi:hypothetical protein
MQSIESSVLSAMNSRTMQILSGKGKLVIAKSKMPDRKALTPKAKRLVSGVVRQLDQVLKGGRCKLLIYWLLR